MTDVVFLLLFLSTWVWWQVLFSSCLLPCQHRCGERCCFLPISSPVNTGDRCCFPLVFSPVNTGVVTGVVFFLSPTLSTQVWWQMLFSSSLLPCQHRYSDRCCFPPSFLCQHRCGNRCCFPPPVPVNTGMVTGVVFLLFPPLSTQV